MKRPRECDRKSPYIGFFLAARKTGSTRELQPAMKRHHVKPPAGVKNSPHKLYDILIGGPEMSLEWRSKYEKSVMGIITAVALGALAGSLVLLSVPQGARSQPPTDDADAIAVAQTSKEAPKERPEQKKTAHDLSDVFNPSNALPSSEALKDQQDRGQMLGFDFYRDPLGAMKPGMTFEDFFY